jgi:hypothetical protein
VVVPSRTCTPPVFVFSALNNSHYFPLYSMTHNLTNSLRGDLLYGTAISCLFQMAHGLFILAHHSNAQRTDVILKSVSLSGHTRNTPARIVILAFTDLATWNTNQPVVTEAKERERPAPRSRVLLEKQVVAQLYRPLSLYGSQRFTATSIQYNTHNVFC